MRFLLISTHLTLSETSAVFSVMTVALVRVFLRSRDVLILIIISSWLFEELRGVNEGGCTRGSTENELYEETCSEINVQLLSSLSIQVCGNYDLKFSWTFHKSPNRLVGVEQL